MREIGDDRYLTEEERERQLIKIHNELLAQGQKKRRARELMTQAKQAEREAERMEMKLTREFHRVHAGINPDIFPDDEPQRHFPEADEDIVLDPDFEDGSRREH